MALSCILTVAVPTFNMERWLEKNLATYQDKRFQNRLEVLCLNNASEDSSKQIMERFVQNDPCIFKLIDRDTRGYGSSINAAIAAARGRYFRIVDADDWVDTEELSKLLDYLETSDTDVVLTDYQIVNMQNGEKTPVRAADKGIAYFTKSLSFAGPLRTLPSIHNTTYRTELLRKSGFYMQDNMFFVDEEYVILPYLSAKSVIYLPFDVYRYQVANPAQSTSPKNRAKYRDHREKILRRLIPAYEKAQQAGADRNALEYCFERIKIGAGDHFTTLYMYVTDKKEGRRSAKNWKNYLKQNATPFWLCVRRKAFLLSVLNIFSVSLSTYEKMKRKLLSDYKKKTAR